MSVSVRPITLTLAALGGQGGGVVSSWLTDVARRERYVVQATSVPGVAQRTGATIYYLEFFPESALPADGRKPLMALMPSPGDVDIVVAAELVEAGRMIQRGLVTPARTTLITSTHRTYTISEKANLDDGRASNERLWLSAQSQARRCIGLDMAQIAERHGAVISAAMLGAIAGAAGLPFTLESYRQAIRRGGIAVDRNLAAFDEGAEVAAAPVSNQQASATLGFAQCAVPKLPGALQVRIDAELPLPAHITAMHAVARLVDYQDVRYAGAYLDSLAPFAALDRAREAPDAPLTEAVARGLALWMSYEDTIRVADLKTRAARRQRVMAVAQARAGQIVIVTEFLKPRVEEICGTLPTMIGARLAASRSATRLLGRLTAGRKVRTSTVSGFLLLRGVAGLRRWRRGTWRYAQEQQRIGAWLEQVRALAARNYELAVTLAHCQRIVRGYGDTYERGLHNFQKLGDAAQRLVANPDGAAQLGRLLELASADDRGDKLQQALGINPA